MSNETQDWDDALDPDARASVMDATRRAMGLPPRNGGFAVGVTDGRKDTIGDTWKKAAKGPNTSAVRQGKGVHFPATEVGIWLGKQGGHA